MDGTLLRHGGEGISSKIFGMGLQTLVDTEREERELVQKRIEKPKKKEGQNQKKKKESGLQSERVPSWTGNTQVGLPVESNCRISWEGWLGGAGAG